MQQQFSGLESEELKETQAIFAQIKMAIQEKSYVSACMKAKELHSFALEMIVKALKNETKFFPLEIADSLAELLGSKDLLWQTDIKYVLSQTCRLFLELSMIKSKAEGLRIPHEMKEKITNHLKRAIETIEERSAPALHFEAVCAIESLKMIDIPTFWARNLIEISQVVGSVGKGLSLIKSKWKELHALWVVDVMFISWIGRQITTEVDLVKELQDKIASSTDWQLSFAAADLYGEWIAGPDVAIQQISLQGLIALATPPDSRLAKAKKTVIDDMWRVRHRALMHLLHIAQEGPFAWRAAAHAAYEKLKTETDHTDRFELEDLRPQLPLYPVSRRETKIELPPAPPPMLPAVAWSFDFQLPALEKEKDLQALISGLKAKCDLNELKERFDHAYELYQDNFPVLSDLIKLCCPYYAAQLCTSHDYAAIRVLHEQLFKALEMHAPENRLEKSLFLAAQLEQWADQLLAKQLPLLAQQFYLSAFEMIDQTGNCPTLSPAQISILEKIGDTHVAMHNHPEGMKFYFAASPYTTLPQKIANTYRGFLAHMGITEYSYTLSGKTTALPRFH